MHSLAKDWKVYFISANRTTDMQNTIIQRDSEIEV